MLTVIGEKNAEHPFIKDECDENEQNEGEDEKKLLKNIDFKK